MPFEQSLVEALKEVVDIHHTELQGVKKFMRQHKRSVSNNTQMASRIYFEIEQYQEKQAHLEDALFNMGMRLLKLEEAANGRS